MVAGAPVGLPMGFAPFGRGRTGALLVDEGDPPVVGGGGSIGGGAGSMGFAVAVDAAADDAGKADGALGCALAVARASARWRRKSAMPPPSTASAATNAIAIATSIVRPRDFVELGCAHPGAVPPSRGAPIRASLTAEACTIVGAAPWAPSPCCD